MRVFLTGATGFIGRALARSLRARGWEVVALVRSPEGAPARALAALGVQCAAGDVSQRDALRAAMQGADMVIHNAGMFELGVDAAGRRRMHVANVVGTEHVLGAALALGVRRAVYVSSVVAFGDTGATQRDETFVRQTPYRSYYDQTKGEAHEIAMGYLSRGLPLITVCPNQVIGPNDHSAWGHFVRLYLCGLMPPVAWAPDLYTAAAHVDEVGEGIALAAEGGRVGEVYLLGGEALRRREILALWGERPGGMRVRAYLPSALAALLFAPVAPLLRAAGLTAFISREVVTGGYSVNYSSAKAIRELGYRHRPGRQLWLDVLDEERALLDRRAGAGLVARLRPAEEGL